LLTELRSQSKQEERYRKEGLVLGCWLASGDAGGLYVRRREESESERVRAREKERERELEQLNHLAEERVSLVNEATDTLLNLSCEYKISKVLFPLDH
jgi:hypothetical protein